MEIISNTFTVTFTNAAAANKAKQIAEESLRALNSEISSNNEAILAAELLSVNKTTLTFDECCFFSEDLMVAAKMVTKAIAFGMKRESFKIEVCGTDTYTTAIVDGTYQNGDLSITTTFFPEGYVEEFECPECGEVIVSLEKYNPNKTYVNRTLPGDTYTSGKTIFVQQFYI